jgi:hypothetical protein
VTDARRALAQRTRGAASLVISAALVLAAGPALLASGCGGAEVPSRWLDREIAVDGDGAEWQGATTYFKDQNLTVGVLNDDQFLYMALFVGNVRDEAQVLLRGCTVWFDPSGGKEEVLGIHYPAGLTIGDRPQTQRQEGGRGAGGMGMGPPGADSLKSIFAGQSKTLEIFGPEPGAFHAQGLSDNGIEVAIQVHETSLVYEIKIPLRRGEGHPYGIGAELGKKIGVGVETPEITQPKREQGMGRRPGGGGGFGGTPGGAPPSGGMPGGGPPPGGMGGGRGGPGGGRPEPPTPLEVWATVKLATSPSQ